MSKIRVLVVDDSAFMRKIIPQMLSEEDSLDVVGTAKDGNEAFKKVIEIKPDVVTLDVEMPGMDGLETLCCIMNERPTPIIMLSAYTPRGAETTLKALEYGAFDFVCKPSGTISIDIKKVKDELVEKIKAAYSANVKKLTVMTPRKASVEKENPVPAQKNSVLVIIAASTGGPRALADFIPKIPGNLPASFLIIQHMSAGFTKTLAERLNNQSLISIKEAENGDVLRPGYAYLAPGNHHMELETVNEEYKIILNTKPTRLGVRPSADVSMFSAVSVFRGKIISVVLTGMGRDGSEGSQKIKDAGGAVITQDRETSVIYGMPKAVAEKGIADEILPLGEMPEILIERIKTAAGKK
ncbi:MAG TPA: chemotaxis response regulator protein-glutamate methylesterase [Firmicutes bacterium]|nr:chemotaxis response regulator protein-glutamate methylesterase [Bacillota bacterium]